MTNFKYKARKFIRAQMLRYLRWDARDSNYMKHAARELHAVGMDEDSDGPNKWMSDHLYTLLAVFAQLLDPSFKYHDANSHADLTLFADRQKARAAQAAGERLVPPYKPLFVARKVTP